MNAENVVASPTWMALRQPVSPQVVSFGVVMAITVGSAPARAPVSSITTSSSSNSWKSTPAKKLVSINNPRITGVIFFISIPPRVRCPFHRMRCIYTMGTMIHGRNRALRADLCGFRDFPARFRTVNGARCL